MSFKSLIIDKLSSSFPRIYILLKSNNFNQAIDTIKGYNIIKKNNLFDESFYLNKYEKLGNSNMDPLLHYIFFGFDEGKSPSPDFDGIFYLNYYDDVKKSDLNPLIHYSLYGLKKDRLCKFRPISNYNDYIDNNKKRILFVLHEKIGTSGGVSFTNLDIIENILDKFQSFILTSTGEEVELWVKKDKLEKIGHWNISYSTDYSIIDFDNEDVISGENFEDNLFNEELNNVYEEVLQSLNIDILHINHLINHSFDLIETSKKLNIPYVLNIHDFYYLCPSIHLLNSKYEYCNLECLINNWGCGGLKLDDSSNLDGIIKTWRKYSLNLLNEAYLNIFPSKSTLDLYKKVYPDLDNVKIIEHGRDFNKIKPAYQLPEKIPIKIAIPGHISLHKGSLLIKDIKNLDINNNLELHFLGTSIPLLKEYGINHGRYKREEFNWIIQEINPSFIAILSTTPETYSHTLSESWNCGIPVIASNLGALRERINETGGGWLVDYRNPQKIHDKIIDISKNKEDYLDKVKNVSKIRFKSKKSMIDEYKEVYGRII